MVSFKWTIFIDEKSYNESSSDEYDEEATSRKNVEEPSSSGIFEIASSNKIRDDEESTSRRNCEEPTSIRISKDRSHQVSCEEDE